MRGITIARAAATAFLITLFAASGCAVYKASSKEGVEPRRAAACETVTCLYALPSSEMLGREEMPDGQIRYMFRALRRQGSTGRAFMHAYADIATLGLWEIVGTPMEGAVQNSEYFVIEAICDASGKCSSVELYELDFGPGAVGAKKGQ